MDHYSLPMTRTPRACKTRKHAPMGPSAPATNKHADVQAPMHASSTRKQPVCTVRQSAEGSPTVHTLHLQPRSTAALETAILSIQTHFAAFKRVCADRSAERFPGHILEAIVRECEVAKTLSADVQVSQEYWTAVETTKDPARFFEERLAAAASEESILQGKREKLSEFATKLRNL